MPKTEKSRPYMMNRSAAMRLSRTAAAELRRAMSEMRTPGHPRPYYISYLIRDEERWRFKAKYGTLVGDVRDRKRNAFADVRVGSYRYDHVREGGLEDNDKDAESYGYIDLPFGSSVDGVRHGLWRLTDARYREALDSLLQKRSHAVTYRNPHRHLKAFERRTATVDLGWQDFPEVDRDYWVGFVEESSRRLRRYRDIKNSYVEFQAEHISRVFVNSEGSRQIHCQPVWSLECYLWLLNARGDAFPWTHRYLVTDPAELPDVGRFLRDVAAAIKDLRRLSEAETLRSFSGPALLEPVPAGLLMHEALGHRLEGNRLLSSGEGQTFKDAVGRRILPEFLTLRDDPRMATFQGKSLVGHYPYDDEGVPAQDARLVERGVLKGYLTSRTGIAPRHRSNGHGRCDYHQRPISRMSVLIAEPENGLDDAALKQALLDEIRRQGVPFGLRIIEASSGETATDAYNFQAFLGEVNLAAKVYPDGREEWIRGINFVGTPLNAVRGILAAGKRLEVDNAYCGAESGYVPVSTITPALVVSELELQSKPEEPYEPYTYPMPWEKV